VAVGGRADLIGTVLKEHYTEGQSLSGALATAIAGLAASANGDRIEIVASQLEVAVLDRTRDHRTFRRLTGARLESLLAESAQAAGAAESQPGEQAGDEAADQPGQGESGDGQASPPGSDSGESSP
jgi:proteasome alpha subunit